MFRLTDDDDNVAVGKANEEERGVKREAMKERGGGGKEGERRT